MPKPSRRLALAAPKSSQAYTPVRIKIPYNKKLGLRSSLRRKLKKLNKLRGNCNAI